MTSLGVSGGLAPECVCASVCTCVSFSGSEGIYECGLCCVCVFCVYIPLFCCSVTNYPQKLVTENNNHCLVAHNFVNSEIQAGSAG